MVRSRRIFFLTGITTAALTGCSLLYAVFFGFNAADFKIVDLYLRQAVAGGLGPRDSGRVVYLTITDETYRRFNRNALDRAGLADMNLTLTRQNPAAVIYDVLFTRPAPDPREDRAFAASLQTGRFYLPVGFALCLYQLPAFARAAAALGHVSAPPDEDRILRHMALLVATKEGFVPALPLAVFLAEYEIPFSDLEIHWGRGVRIPARPERGLAEDLFVPIDERGRVFVSFAGAWNFDFPQMRADSLMDRARDPALSGNLADFFEGRFVFVGDVSSGVADAADTPLERRVPLLALHAHVLNALFTGDLYARAGFTKIALIQILSAFVLLGSAMLRRSFVFYAATVLVLVGLFAFGWFSFRGFALLPVASIGGGITLTFLGTLIALRAGLNRERTTGLKRLNAELFALKNHLEDLVQDRTRELKSTLQQIENDLETARQVQQKILPPVGLRLPGLELYYEYRPLDRVGGDLIDVAELRPGVVRVFLADAVGHGVQASLLTMAVKSEYEELKRRFDQPNHLLEEYNRRLIAKYKARLFSYIPCFVADLDLNAGILRHASSGMPDQFCFSPGMEPTPLTHTGPAVGFLPEVTIDPVESPFPPGSLLLLYSDGLPETQNTRSALFGEERIIATVRGLGPEGAADPTRVVSSLLVAAREFRAGHRVLDDLTVLALYRKRGDSR